MKASPASLFDTTYSPRDGVVATCGLVHDAGVAVDIIIERIAPANEGVIPARRFVNMKVRIAIKRVGFAICPDQGLIACYLSRQIATRVAILH